MVSFALFINICQNNFGYSFFNQNLCKLDKQNKKTIVGDRWNYQPQEQEGDYWFDGNAYMTNNIQEQIPSHELQAIILFLKRLVEQKKGLDYLQVFKLENGTKIFVIDNLSRSQKEIYAPEHHYFTILFSYEY